MVATKISDLTVDELRQLIREEFRSLIREAVDEALDASIDEDDFDEDTNFRSDVTSQLRRFRDERPRGKPVDDLTRELGLDD